MPKIRLKYGVAEIGSLILHWGYPSLGLDCGLISLDGKFPFVHLALCEDKVPRKLMVGIFMNFHY